MGKKILFTTLGFVLTIGGFALGYMCLLGVEKGGNMLLLIPAILLIGGGVFLLLKAGRTETSKPQFKDTINAPIAGDGGVLDRNNKMASEWNKTNETKDKLKAVQASAIVSNEQK